MTLFLARHAGFTLVEMAVALIVVGVMAAAASSYSGAFKAAGKTGADALLASESESIIEFARTRGRLPCPDVAGTGYESLVANVCPAGVDVGWMPYVSMGLSLPSASARSIYGVYRNVAAGADLAATASLNSLAAATRQVASNAFVYVTGDGTTANGTESCAGNVRTNAAFVVLTRGEDRSGDGALVDGIHSTLPAVGRCFAAPSRAFDFNFDDRTYAVSAFALMAKLNP
jgi:prepilin-type N-terminal cleavage/methylation domain-containing protein